MTIGKINQTLISNMHQVGGQTQSIKKKDTTVTQNKEGINERDTVDISPDERGRKAGETIGTAGREGKEHTKKTEEVIDKADTAQMSSVEDPVSAEKTPDMILQNSDDGLKHMGDTPFSPGTVPTGANNGSDPSMAATPSMADTAAKQKAMQDDMQQAQTIYAQMAADRQKWMMKMWEIIQETQTKIMEIMQQAAIRRASAMDNIAKQWAACLGEYKL